MAGSNLQPSSTWEGTAQRICTQWGVGFHTNRCLCTAFSHQKTYYSLLLSWDLQEQVWSRRARSSMFSHLVYLLQEVQLRLALSQPPRAPRIWPSGPQWQLPPPAMNTWLQRLQSIQSIGSLMTSLQEEPPFLEGLLVSRAVAPAAWLLSTGQTLYHPLFFWAT
jgi:hypothetical protein